MAKLLDLPNELLFEIIAFCRMVGFESIMLTCRRSYAIGLPLIESYEKNRRWLKSETSPTPYLDVINNLRKLARKPDLDKDLALSIVKDLKITRYKPHGHWMRVLHHLIKHHAPAYNDLDHALSAIKHVWPGDLETHTLRADVKRDILTFLEGRGTIWTVPAPIAGHREYQCLHPIYFDLAALCLFHGLQRLEIDGDVAQILEWSLPDRFQKRDSRSLFPALQDVHICGEYRVLNRICLWLCLPRLRSILIDKLDARDRTLEDGQLATNERPVRDSTLEHLVVTRSDSNMDELGPILKTSSRLRTFAFRMDRYEKRQPVQPDRDCTVMQSHSDYIIHRGDIYAPARYAADVESGCDDAICACLLPTCASLDAKTMINALPRSTLEHLILTVETSHKGLAAIPSRECTTHLKLFPKLTHLEIDTLFLLRAAHTTTFSNATRKIYKPKSLVDYLPPTIIFVRLHMNTCDEDPSDLLGDLHERKSELPHLKQISILDPQISSRRSRYRALRPKLREAGINLVTDEYDPPAGRVVMRLARQDGSSGTDTTYFPDVVMHQSRGERSGG